MGAKNLAKDMFKVAYLRIVQILNLQAGSNVAIGIQRIPILSSVGIGVRSIPIFEILHKSCTQKCESEHANARERAEPSVKMPNALSTSFVKFPPHRK
jgi:hypothetical protein